eukprot:6174766-Pleurochrysis_carterae.AAC.4
MVNEQPRRQPTPVLHLLGLLVAEATMKPGNSSGKRQSHPTITSVAEAGTSVEVGAIHVAGAGGGVGVGARGAGARGRSLSGSTCRRCCQIAWSMYVASVAIALLPRRRPAGGKLTAK